MNDALLNGQNNVVSYLKQQTKSLREAIVDG